MGPVFRAYDSDRDCLVAIKAFKLDLLPEQTASFVDALHAIAARPPIHDAIVSAGDAGLEGVTPFLALEYASGDRLDAILRDGGAVRPSDALALCRSLAEAIDAGWDQGVGHGALHPRDVFIQGAAVAVTGFGVVQALEAHGLKAPVRRPYTAPERAAGDPWDRRADVYSLAAIARELLARQTAVEENSALHSVLDRALASAPDARYTTAAEMMTALNEALETDSGSRFLAPIAPENTENPVERNDSGSRFLFPDANPVDAALIHAAEPIELGIPVQREAVLPSPSATVRARQPFPWAAMAAVALAGAALGGVAGYQAGLAEGEDVAIARAILGTPSPSATPATTQPADPDPAPSYPEASIAPAVSGPAAAQRPRPAPGSVYVDSRPRGARVTVDGRSMGQTPLPIEGLSPGDHRVLIELAGHRRVESTVRVVAGERVPLKVTLEQTQFGGSRPGGR